MRSDIQLALSLLVFVAPGASAQDPAVPDDRSPARAIALGLAWLAAHQDDDGRWDADGFMKHDLGPPTDGPGGASHDVGVTGLALLALLGGGTTMRAGPPPRRGQEGRALAV